MRSVKDSYPLVEQGGTALPVEALVLRAVAVLRAALHSARMPRCTRSLVAQSRAVGNRSGCRVPGSPL